MIDLSRASRNTDPANLKDIPGPGYYTSPTPRQMVPYAFGRSERAVSDFSSNKYEDIPGPGAYSYASNSTSISSKTPFNTSSARFPSLECTWKPGPGSYHQSQLSQQPKRKIVQTLCIHPSPVPVSIPLLERHELAIYDGHETKVSPAEYNPKFDQIKPRNPASLFSKSRIPKVYENYQGNENLGPGAYFLETTEASFVSRHLSMEKRFKEKTTHSPGPGSYDPNISISKPSPPRPFLSKLERSLNIAKNIVQDYPQKKKKTIEKKIMNAVFASASKRDCNKIAASSPIGPGKYEISPIKKEGFKFNAEPRFKNKEESPVGPGTYDPQELPNRSSPVNLKSPRFRKLSDLYVHEIGQKSYPGPGDYEIQITGKKQYKGLAFETSSGRIDRKYNLSPDPGQYHNDYQPSGGHKIGGELRFKPGIGSYIQGGSSNEFVGPGSYRQKVSLVKRTHNISWI